MADNEPGSSQKTGRRVRGTHSGEDPRLGVGGMTLTPSMDLRVDGCRFSVIWGFEPVFLGINSLAFDAQRSSVVATKWINTNYWH